MNHKPEKPAVDYLVLVNAKNPVPADWDECADLILIRNSHEEDIPAERAAGEAFLRLKKDLEAENVHIELDSGYRTLEEQQQIREDFTLEYGEEYVKRYVAVPGYSEHQTGLALDLYFLLDGKDVYQNEDLFAHPEVWVKIHAKLADHGFILRYPENREEITGIGYEPWHIRYVGRETAEKISAAGQCLEEYHGK